MKKVLTRKQKESYQCILNYTKEHGYPPTVREFGELIGVKSTSSAFSRIGQLAPIFFTWEDGRKYSIDRILKIERCASRKAGGVGVMYTCMIQGQESHLFYEVDKWFMERKTA